MMKVLALALILAGCAGPQPVALDWNSNLPDGGVVIYHVDHGLGFCDLAGCPTRIIQVGGTCITETYQLGRWGFRESKPCAR
jgi:hypothetical protein